MFLDARRHDGGNRPRPAGHKADCAPSEDTSWVRHEADYRRAGSVCAKKMRCIALSRGFCADDHRQRPALARAAPLQFVRDRAAARSRQGVQRFRIQLDRRSCEARSTRMRRCTVRAGRSRDSGVRLLCTGPPRRLSSSFLALRPELRSGLSTPEPPAKGHRRSCGN